MDSGRLLIPDDDPGICDFAKDVAHDLDLAVIVPSVASDIRTGLISFDPSVIFLDLPMPDSDGIEVNKRLSDEGTMARVALPKGRSTQSLQ